jgi:hypothetical protein
MDTPQQSSSSPVPPPPFAVPATHTVSPALKITAIVMVVLAIIISIVAYTPHFLKKNASGKEDYLVSVTLPNVTRSYLYTYTENPPANASRYNAYTVAVADKKLPVLDLISVSPKESYYLLLENESSSVSNIYKSDAGVVTKITNSATPKRSISIDAKSGMISYQTPKGTGDEWETVVYNTTSSKELRTGILSFHSAVIPGGESLFVVGSTSLYAVPIQRMTRKMLVPIANPHLVAISRDGLSVAVYNNVTKSIDSYHYSNATGLSFVSSSKPLPEIAHAISFVGNDLVATYKNSTTPSLYTIKNVATGAETSRFLVGPQLIPDRIALDHE